MYITTNTPDNTLFVHTYANKYVTLIIRCKSVSSNCLPLNIQKDSLRQFSPAFEP